MNIERFTAFEIRQSEEIEPSRLFVSLSDYYDLLIMIQDLKEEKLKLLEEIVLLKFQNAKIKETMSKM